MNMLKKLVIILVCILLALTTLTSLVGSVYAAGNLSCQASISSKNPGVAQDTTYTFTITNVGTSNLGAANITIPNGYRNIRNAHIEDQPASQNWTVAIENNTFLLYDSNQGLSTGQKLTFSFDGINPQVAGNYKWVIGASEIAGIGGLNASEFSLTISYAAVINSIYAAIFIFLIASGIAVLNTGINRVLINYFIGWEQYRVMQKEMAEYRSETMAAARANDKKQMEKLKKKQSQINNMQSKMMKPQMVQLGISFLYIFIWIFVLTPTYGNTSMVFIPGLGPFSVVYWYPICSFFLGLLATRLMGTMPIEN